MTTTQGDNKQHNCSEQEHLKHLAHAVEVFESQHGSEYKWDSQEVRWHDILIETINREDGYLS